MILHDAKLSKCLHNIYIHVDKPLVTKHVFAAALLDRLLQMVFDELHHIDCVHRVRKGEISASLFFGSLRLRSFDVVRIPIDQGASRCQLL